MPAIAIAHKAEIIERLASGHYMRTIAADLGVSAQAISNQLSQDPDYQAALSASLDAQLEIREEQLEGATDGLGVARARELLSHARWRAERLNPARWGQVRPAAPAVAVQVNIGSIERRIVRVTDSASAQANGADQPPRLEELE